MWNEPLERLGAYIFEHTQIDTRLSAFLSGGFSSVTPMSTGQGKIAELPRSALGGDI